MGNDDVLMGVFPKFSVFDILEGKEIEDIIEEGPEGIYLLAGGSGLNRIEDLSEEERSIFLDTAGRRLQFQCRNSWRKRLAGACGCLAARKPGSSLMTCPPGSPGGHHRADEPPNPKYVKYVN